MAVQSSPSQQPLVDHLRMGQNVNTETLSMSAPNLNILCNWIDKLLIFEAQRNKICFMKNLFIF